MSLVYLAAVLERDGHHVTVYDASLGPIVRTGHVYRYGFPDEDVRRYLAEARYDFVGITCSFTSRWRFVDKIARLVKDVTPDVPVAVGGLFPTSEWAYCLREGAAVDLVLLGEAELTFSQIVQNVVGGKRLSEACRDVDGVAWRSDGEIQHNPKQVYNERLDDLPFPAWHLVDLKRYFQLQKKIFELPVPCLPVLSSRSCPMGCTFCNMYITHGRAWRPRSPENVLDELEYLIKRFGVRHFYFVDDNFSLRNDRAKEICRGILERKLKIKYNFHNGLSIKTLDEELIQGLKDSGCTSVCLAVESGSERVRNKVYGKGLKTEKIFQVFNWCHQAGIPTIGYFMVGAPGETRKDFEESKALVAKLPMSLATVGIYTPYPKTALYDESKEKGWLIEPPPEDENRVEMCSVMLRTPDFEPEDVAGWQKELYFCFIRHHWPTLLQEFFRPWGVVNWDMIGKFWGIIKFHLLNRNRA